MLSLSNTSDPWKPVGTAVALFDRAEALLEEVAQDEGTHGPQLRGQAT